MRSTTPTSGKTEMVILFLVVVVLGVVGTLGTILVIAVRLGRRVAIEQHEWN